MPVVRKVQSKIKLSASVVESKPVVEKKVSKPTEDAADAKNAPRKKKVCQFCKSKTEPRYWDAAVLRRHMNDRGRISTRTRSGACAKHQRRVAKEIKRARHLALLPFTVRI